jgi:RNA polymerase sigma-70 factor (ECF subfamily)
MTSRLEHRVEDRRDEATLVAAMRQGDESAFTEVVDRYHRSLIRLARVHVEATAAEDVAQETWLAVVRGLRQFEGRASFKTWLFHILVNRARTRAVRDARTVALSSLASAELHLSEAAVDPARFRGPDDRWPGHWLVPPQGGLPEEELLAAELREHIRGAVEQLPPAQRAVVTLRDIDGLDADEVCQLLELTDGNQRVLLHRGRSKLRAALEQVVRSRNTP